MEMTRPLSSNSTHAELCSRFEETESKLAALQKQRDKMKADAITIGGMMFELGELDALYPADSLAPKYFKTFYLNGELQGEGNFIELGDRNDANSIFDGEIDYYYPGGALKRRMFYSNGKSNGECSTI